MKCAPLIALLALSASAFSAEPSDADRDKLESISDALSKAPTFAMNIHFPGNTNVAVFKFDGAKDQNRPTLYRASGDEHGNTQVSLSVLSFILKTAFTTIEQPGIKFVFRIPDAPDLTAYPKGIPESTFALKMLLGKKEFATWAAGQNIPPPNACPIQQCEEDLRNAPWTDAVEIKTPTPESEAALKSAKSIYDQRRAELIARFNQSYLFYAEAAAMHWTTQRKDKTWFVRTHCADKMFYAKFVIQLDPAADASLQCTQIHAGEFFKGE